jgi:ketosteroid isomerase-like protein
VGDEMTNDEIIDAYGRAFEAADADQVRALIAPGAVMWHNFDQVELDISEALNELGRMTEYLDGMHFDIQERFPVQDGIGMRLVLRGVLKATGEPFASHQAKFFRIHDGKITRIEEYVAPAGLSS